MYKGILDILAVGHSTHDIIVREHATFSRLGESPSYISRLLESLNRAVGTKAKENYAEVDYAIVSKVGPDFRYSSELSQEPLVAAKRTTCFVHHYQSSGREMQVKSICEAIFPEDIQSESRIGLIVGVIGEVPPDTFERIASVCKITFCDVQGLIRKVDHQKRVYHVDLATTEFCDVLPKIDFLRLNRLEAQFVKVKEISRKSVVLLTKGKDGCTIMEKGKEFEISTRPLPQNDPTGAGDFFLGGFAYGILRGYSLERCAQIANYCGGLVVGTVGIPTEIKLKEGFL